MTNAIGSIGDMLFSIGLQEGRYTDPLSLARHHAQVYSQNGEDGIIAEIFRRIGVTDRLFIEIGVGTGQENNTRLLLEQGWRGVWIDANRPELARARDEFSRFTASGALVIVEAIACAETIEAILDTAGLPGQVDFLSLDIDQNTSHVWRSLQRRARVACIEYNASVPASVALEVAYDPARPWDGSNGFGGSLKSLETIGSAKAMSLVGCDLLGVNAFFVGQGEAAGRFREPFIAEAHWEPPRYHLTGHSGHPPSIRAGHWQDDNGR